MLASEVLQIERYVDSDSVRLNLRGDIDLSTAPPFDEALREAERSRPDRVVVDCSGLSFIDSSGLAVLVEANRRAAERNRALVLSGVPPQAERLLAITGLAARFTFE